jgi:glycosyltransferase involved in cell wall biosynthesis
MDRVKPDILISIVTPCFNEQLSIKECIESVRELMSSLKGFEYEHIIADNRSTDSTVQIVKDEMARDTKIKLIVNSRNVGPFRNMWNALKSFLLRAARHCYYRIIKRFSDADIPVDAGEFLLVDRRVLNSVLSVDDEYPYIRGLIAQTGVPYETVEYNWNVRKHGQSKNSIFNLFDQAINGFVSTSKVSGRIVLVAGFLISFASICLALVMAVSFLFFSPQIGRGIPLLIVSMFFIGGIQIFFLGVLGEYILSMHSQVRKSPPMFETERLNFRPSVTGEKNG